MSRKSKNQRLLRYKKTVGNHMPTWDFLGQKFQRTNTPTEKECSVQCDDVTYHVIMSDT